MIDKKRVKTGDFVIAAFAVIIMILCLLPMLNLFSRSLSSPDALIKNEVTFLPKGINFGAYELVLKDPKFTWALLWTAIITVLGVCLSLFMTTLCAYPLVFDKLKGKTFFNTMIIFTMYFNAGTIPMYLLLKDINMLNKPIVLIVPYTLNVFYMIIMKNYFYSIPASLRESAEIDGASPLKILFHIYLPVSAPVTASLALFYAVGRWNGFSDALMFMNDRRFYPIQLLLYNLIYNISSIEISLQEGFMPPGLSENIKAATIMFATVPILIVYPWLQKYFIKGVTLGAIKE